ncbi:MAG: hypothetical protein LC624_03885, partial [Halobacteriales archaeon]|nr:hypothetical protein [Halobacteriales archaeon]
VSAPYLAGLAGDALRPCSSVRVTDSRHSELSPTLACPRLEETVVTPAGLAMMVAFAAAGALALLAVRWPRLAWLGAAAYVLAAATSVARGSVDPSLLAAVLGLLVLRRALPWPPRGKAETPKAADT